MRPVISQSILFIEVRKISNGFIIVPSNNTRDGPVRTEVYVATHADMGTQINTMVRAAEAELA